uniref:Aquaporin n=1 Tax=Glossina morsitans morsitans TaxID=37546 RepID=D3TMN2_GLOMM|nr:aquaporin 5 [Glossina morsitans morsitans]
MHSSVRHAVKCFFAEILGTGLLVFLGCMGCSSTVNSITSPLQASINVSLVVMMMVQCFGCISGAHINPMITVAACVYDLVSIPLGLVYVCAQILGAMFGYGLLKVFLPAYIMDVAYNDHGFCVTVPAKDITVAQAFGIEFIITSVFVMVCCGIWDPRSATLIDSVALRLGLTVGGLVGVAGSFSGASMNPARSLGPALWHMDFENHWIYWVAPLTSSLLTSYLYKYFFRSTLRPGSVSDI